MENSILPGIKICSDLVDIYNKVSVNTGVRKRSFNISTRPGLTNRYSGYAPLSDWRKLCSPEIESLFYKDSLKHGFVRLSKLPNYITDEYFLSAKRFGNYDSGMKKILLIKYIEKIQDYLCENYLLGGAPQFFGLRILKKLEIPTITYDENVKSYIGLHIDCWDSNNVDNKDYRNRICVNLGTGPRFFYFINLNIQQIKDLFENAEFLQGVQKKELSLHFLKKQSSYPVTRLTLNPGEYYVAPTEKIIHDACFIENEDITITLLGHFG